MKKKNQGFMLVEALIMSIVIIGVLVFMYIQFQNISRSYDKSFHYNTVTGLYITNEIKVYLDSNSYLDTIKDTVKTYTDKCYDITNYTSDASWASLKQEGKIKTILICYYENDDDLKGKRRVGLSEKFNDFINYIKKEKNTYRILLEFEDDTYASFRLGDD